jgi:hypothetical protein
MQSIHNLSGDLAGIAAFQLVAELIIVLEKKGNISNGERGDIFRKTASFFQKSSDERAEFLEKYLMAIADAKFPSS